MSSKGFGRGRDGVYRDPIPRGMLIRLAIAAAALLCLLGFAVVRACGRGEEPVQAPRPASISCVGDSITFGYGLSNRDATCWTELLPGLLDDGSTTANFGVTGSCALRDGAYPWIRTALAYRFWESEEDIVILMLGTNDVCDGRWDAAEFERDYAELVADIQAKPSSPQVFVMIPPAIYASPDLDARLVEEAAPAIERVAEEAGATVIDLHALTAGHPEWLPDGIHPNEEGNEAIAELIAEVLEKR